MHLFCTESLPDAIKYCRDGGLVVTGGEDENGEGGFAYYKRRIAEFSSRYEKVLMLGDSMGAASSCCSHPKSQLPVPMSVISSGQAVHRGSASKVTLCHKALHKQECASPQAAQRRCCSPNWPPPCTPSRRRCSYLALAALPRNRLAQALHDDAAWSEYCLQMQSALPLRPPHIRNPIRQNAGEHLRSCMLPRIANTFSIAHEP